MRSRLFGVTVMILWAGCAIGYAQMDARGDRAMNWTIPETASAERNPLTVTPDVLAKGRSVFLANCQACHGPAGRNDGPNNDPNAPNADLTDGFRVSINPDGVVFYKVWNGRLRPRMPAFSGVLSRDETWAVVEYVQSLREPK